MPPKDKKPKKPKKEEEDKDDDQLTAVDRQFYELNINDLNRKLARLRNHNDYIEERNEELETKMKQMEEDRNDVTGYLNRTLRQKVNIIQELEDKLTELSKVRKDENEDCKRRMLEWENKYKSMHDHLTSEIKLLTGKLNSMEEFRLQRDELMAKFDAQEAELKEQQKRHKQILYEMERKVILDKESMRKDVENKLLELSTEFTKSSEIRVAAHTQRLVRENIALNNEMDRMIFTQQRLQEENEQMKKKHKEIVDQFEADASEKKRLIKTCEQQIEIIERLTTELEKQKDLTDYLMDIKRSHEVVRKMTKDNRKELQDLKDEIAEQQENIEVLNLDRQKLKVEAEEGIQEFERISNIIKAVRFTVRSAISGENDTNDPAFRESQRKNLLADLLNILNDLEKKNPNLESDVNIYDQGDLGFTRQPTADTFKSLAQTSPQNDVEVVEEIIKISSIESITELPPAPSNESKLSDPPVLLDIVSGTTLYKTESEASTIPEGEKKDLKEAFEKPPAISEQKSSEKKMLSIDLQASFEQQPENDDGVLADLEEEGEAEGEEEMVMEEEEVEHTQVEIDGEQSEPNEQTQVENEGE